MARSVRKDYGGVRAPAKAERRSSGRALFGRRIWSLHPTGIGSRFLCFATCQCCGSDLVACLFRSGDQTASR